MKRLIMLLMSTVMMSMSLTAADIVTVHGEFTYYGSKTESRADCERLVEKEIKGEMEESYSVIRDNGDGPYELQTFYIVSESAASKARLRALENALKESEAAQRNADKISSFVREGFEQQ